MLRLRSRRWKICSAWVLVAILVVVSVLVIPGPLKFFISGVLCKSSHSKLVVVVGVELSLFARFIDADHFPLSAFFLCAGAYFFSFGSV